MRYLSLILFAILEVIIGMLGMFILKDVRGIIALPAILLIVGIVLKVTSRNDDYADSIWYLLWSSALVVGVLLPIVIMIGKIEC